MTCLRKAPDAARLVGPEGENGVCSWLSRTASQFSRKPKLKTTARAIGRFCSREPCAPVDFRFAEVSNRGVCSIERTIGKRFRIPAHEQSRGKHGEQRTLPEG